MTAAPATQPDDQSGAFYRPGPELAPIVDRVLRMPEHRHLIDFEARIGWLMRAEPKVKQGRQVLGTCYRPRVNGELSGLFDWMLERLFGEEQDFLVILDAEYWAEADARSREILVYHELMHADVVRDEGGEPKLSDTTGLPSWTIRGHDIEEFNRVVARYGVHSEDLREFIAAAAHGDTVKDAANVRRLR